MLDSDAFGRLLGEVSDALVAGLAVLDAHGTVLRANRALGDLLGTPPEALVGTALDAHLHPACRADEQSPVDGADGQDGPRLRRRVNRADGGQRLVDVVLTPVPGPCGEAGLVVVQVLPDGEDATPPGRQPSRVPLRVIQARAVEEAATALAGAVTVSEVSAVMERQMPAFAATGLLVSLVEGPRLRLISSSGYADELLPRLRDQPLQEPAPMTDTVRERSAIFLETLDDYAARYPDRAAFGTASGKQAWAVLPMVAGGQAIGAWVLSYDSPHRFTVSERALLTTLSGLLAQALSRSAMLAAERSVSQALQRSLLPASVPDVPGCRIAVRYAPAVAGMEVGGDFYDVIPLPRGGTGIVIGDAQGHSAPAAALMGQVRAALRAYAAEGHDPATVVARANRFLMTAGADRFVTCTYAALDAAHDGISVVRAGHPHPLLVTPDGAVGTLDVAGGLPLGIDSQASYPVTWFPLSVGCRVVLYTDGLVEERSADGAGAERALLARIRRAAGTDLDAFADAVVADRPSHEDDVAVLVLERVGTHPDDLRQETFSATTADRTSVRRIRRAVSARCRDWGWAGRADEVELLVSELVTNAVVHVGGTVAVTLTASSSSLTVAVADTSLDSPSPKSAGPWETSGRGLVIVESIADDWGIDPSGPGKSVWFSLHDRSA